MAFIGSRDAEITHAVMEWLLEHEKWDVLKLGWMDEAQAQRMVQALGSARTHRHLVTEAAGAPLLRLPASWDAYFRTLSPAFRAGLLRSRRGLEREHGTAFVRRVASPVEFERIWSILVSLHQRRWTARGRRGAFADPKFAEFHHRFALVALERSWLRLFSLEIGSAVAAVLYCLRFGPRVFYFQSGFDLAWSRFGPGRLLMAEAIRSAIEEGATEFDFLRGTERHKLFWHPEIRRDVHLTIFRRDLRVAFPVVWQERLRAARAQLARG